MPQLVAVARRSRSLFLGLRGSLPAGDGSPVFLAPRGGTQQLAAALDGRLRAEGVEFVTERVRVVRSEDRDGVAVDGGRFDACVLATDAAESAALLGDRAPAGLRSIATASVALVTMGGPEMELPEGTSGLLVPRRFGRLMTACSFASHKWPHWAAPGRAVLRVSAGRIADDRIDSLDDETLVGRLADELSSVLGKPFRPETHRVSRWPDSFPQYRVGHLQLVDGIEEDLRRDHPGVAVCGASYRGVGIPACIGSGRAAARALVQRAG